MSSGDASWIVQCNLGILNRFRLLSIKDGRGFPRTLFGVTCIWFDLVIKQLLLQERVMSVFDEFKRDIHSQVKNLSFLKMTPWLNTGQ